MSEFRVGLPTVVATIENAPLITVQGTIFTTSIQTATFTIATVEALGTVENAPLITVQGAVTGSVPYPVVIATIENAPLVTIEGTLSATLSTAVTVSTIENQPLLTVTGTVDVQNLIQPSSSGAVQSFDVTVGTVETAISSDISLIYQLTILADEDNSAVVRVGSSTLRTFPLKAGASVTLALVKPVSVYAVSTIAPQLLHVIYGGD